MKVVFETAGGQQLKAELSGDEWHVFEHKVFNLIKDVRDTSCRDVNVPARIHRFLDDFTLLVKEPPCP